MNDRFRYRVWDKENKCMHYPIRYGNFSIVNGTVVKIESYPTANSAYLGKRIAWEFDDAIIMQCTGLKDKNGKLIYEGDILQQPQLPHKVVCEWYKDGFWLNGFMNGAKRELRNMHNWYEVIGNIYENKELLESEG